MSLFRGGLRLGLQLPQSRYGCSSVSSCTYISPSVRSRSSCSACRPWCGWRTSPPALTSRAVPPTPGGVSPSGSSSTGTPTFGVGSLLRGLTCGGVPCRLQCTTRLSAQPDVFCIQILPKRLSFFFLSKLRCTGATSEAVAGEKDISINVIELLGMVVSAWVLVSPCVEHPSATGDWVLLRRDNEAAVEWVRRCRGGKEPRSGALMRLLEALELSSSWYFDAKHVRGVFNVTAGGISRWGRDLLLRNLHSVCPDVPWKARDLAKAGTPLCTSVLASSRAYA